MSLHLTIKQFHKFEMIKYIKSILIIENGSGETGNFIDIPEVE